MCLRALLESDVKLVVGFNIAESLKLTLKSIGALRRLIGKRFIMDDEVPIMLDDTVEHIRKHKFTV